MTRVFVGSERGQLLIGLLRRLKSYYSSVCQLVTALNKVKDSEGDALIYPNRVHTLLKACPTSALNEQQFLLIEAAANRLQAQQWLNQPLADAASLFRQEQSLAPRETP